MKRTYTSPDYEIEKFVVATVFTNSSLDNDNPYDVGDDGFDF